MNNILIVLILCIVIFSCCIGISFAGYKLLKKDTKVPSNEKQQITTLIDGNKYTISKDNVYIGQDFDTTRGKGKMCDAKGTNSSSDAAPFKFTKDGDSWIVATDCDGDGNYTSFLNGNSDLIASRNKKNSNTQRWYVSCLTNGCTFKNKETNRYLGGTFSSPVFSEDKTLFSVLSA